MAVPTAGDDSMSDKDNATRVFLSDREVFSDAFNGTLFNGRQIVKPQDLSELDPVSAIGVARPFQSLMKTKRNKPSHTEEILTNSVE